ncbi:hypothetical protein DOT_0973 [Desulfosporosinus sp. OT]|nr:hypothetical protein DOT_0973 [Desulfosporosinus sp. OT]
MLRGFLKRRQPVKNKIKIIASLFAVLTLRLFMAQKAD